MAATVGIIPIPCARLHSCRVHDQASPICRFPVTASSASLAARNGIASRLGLPFPGFGEASGRASDPHATCMKCGRHRPVTRAVAEGNEFETSTERRVKLKSILCSNCTGNGAVVCSQCQGQGLNAVDHFNGRFKAGHTCWLCRGKKQMLCGECNGAGFIGGFMNTQDD